MALEIKLQMEHCVRVDFNIPGHPTQQPRLRVRRKSPPTKLVSIQVIVSLGVVFHVFLNTIYNSGHNHQSLFSYNYPLISTNFKRNCKENCKNVYYNRFIWSIFGQYNKVVWSITAIYSVYTQGNHFIPSDNELLQYNTVA